MSKEFLNAIKYVRKLSQTPSNEELTNLYKYYKQATIGNININEPSILNLKKRQKWKAWNSVKNMNKNKAEYEYVLLVNILIQKYGII